MLDYIRRRKSGLVSWLIVGFVAVVFIFWGIGTRQATEQRAATVNGVDIGLAELDGEARRLQERYREAFGGQLPEKLFSYDTLRRQALDNLITRVLLRQEAERLGIETTDDEVRRAIMAIPSFHRDGRFDPELYRRAFAGGSVPGFASPAAYEAALREQQAFLRLERLVRDAVAVTDSEAAQAYHSEKDMVAVEYARVPARPDSRAPVPEDELSAYYETHRDAYRRPAAATAVLARIAPEALAQLVTVTEDEVRAAYEARKDELATPAGVSARHILIRVDESADEPAVDRARAKAQAALARVRKGEDFSRVALEVSEDPSKGTDPKTAGDLGFFRRGEMVAAFEEAAFALKPGQVSDVVRTQFGFHVIKADRVQEARSRTFAEVRGELTAEIRLEKSTRHAGELAEQLAQQAARSGDLAAEAKALGVGSRTVGPLEEGRAGDGLSQPVVAQLFRLAPREVSPPLQDGPAWVVVQTTQRTEAVTPPLGEVLDRVKAGLAKQKAAQAARERAAKLLEAARASGDLKSAAKAAGLEAKTTPLFERRAREVPGIGPVPTVAEAAFELSAESPFPREALQVGDDALVVRLLQRKAADPAADPDGLASARRMLQREKGEVALRQLVETRRGEAKVWINPVLEPAPAS